VAAARRRIPVQRMTPRSGLVQPGYVDITNRDPLRCAGHSGALTRLTLTHETDLVLRQQGMDRASTLLRASMCVCAPMPIFPPAARRPTSPAASTRTPPAWPNWPPRCWPWTSPGDILAQDITRPLAEQGGAIVWLRGRHGLGSRSGLAAGAPGGRLVLIAERVDAAIEALDRLATGGAESMCSPSERRQAVAAGERQ
jgi:hypothetical protein